MTGRSGVDACLISGDGARSAITDNVLDRQFQADTPNQKWVADFTGACCACEAVGGTTMASKTAWSMVMSFTLAAVTMNDNGTPRSSTNR